MSNIISRKQNSNSRQLVTATPIEPWLPITVEILVLSFKIDREYRGTYVNRNPIWRRRYKDREEIRERKSKPIPLPVARARRENTLPLLTDTLITSIVVIWSSGNRHWQHSRPDTRASYTTTWPTQHEQTINRRNRHQLRCTGYTRMKYKLIIPGQNSAPVELIKVIITETTLISVSNNYIVMCTR